MKFKERLNDGPDQLGKELKEPSTDGPDRSAKEFPFPEKRAEGHLFCLLPSYP